MSVREPRVELSRTEWAVVVGLTLLATVATGVGSVAGLVVRGAVLFALVYGGAVLFKHVAGE